MTFLRIDSSVRTEGSVSRAVTDSVQDAWLAARPDGEVVRRDLARTPVASEAWIATAAARGVAEEDRTPEQRAAFAAAAELADELLAADAIAVGAPLYNFGVPQTLKTWIDLVIADPRFGPGTTPLAGVPVTLVIARGGGYGPGTPRDGWDHATPYLLRIFRDVWQADVTVVETELTLAHSVPAMAGLRDVATASQERAHALAAETGRRHAVPTAA